MESLHLSALSNLGSFASRYQAQQYHVGASLISLKPTYNACVFTRWKANKPLMNKLQKKKSLLIAKAYLDLSEDNINKVLLDARTELLQLFDGSVGITGTVELAELDGPFVTLRLKGRFWHQRSLVLARIASYLQQRIPEILEVNIEDESQMDDSPANF